MHFQPTTPYQATFVLCYCTMLIVVVGVVCEKGMRWEGEQKYYYYPITENIISILLWMLLHGAEEEDVV